MEKKPEDQLEVIIKSDSLIDLSTDYAELVVDGILDDGLLKDIPAVGTLVGLVKFGNSINQHLFAKKIYKFLFELSSIPASQRLKMIEQINESRPYQSRVGLLILETLDKVESNNKPEILGKLFKAVVEEKIEFKMYMRLAHIVKSLFIDDLITLKKNVDGENVLDGGLIDPILLSGLVKYGFDISEDGEKNDTLTPLGSALFNFGLK